MTSARTVRAAVLVSMASLWSCASKPSSPTPQSANDKPAITASCKDFVPALSRSPLMQDPRAALREVELAYRRCGDGHLLMTMKAAIHLQQRELDLAAKALVLEFRAEHDSTAPESLLMSLVPQLSEAQRKQFAELGTTAREPLYLSGFAAFDPWSRVLLCSGVPMTSVQLEDVWESERWIRKNNVECPKGNVTTRYVAYSQTFRRDRQGGAKAERKIVRPLDVLMNDGFEYKWGIHDDAGFRAKVAEPLSRHRSNLWLVGNLLDYPRGTRIAASMLKEDPQDLEAALMLSQIQLQLGRVDEALRTLRQFPRTEAVVRDTRSGSTRLSALDSRLCWVHLAKGNLQEAEKAGAAAVSGGSQINGPFCYGQVLFLLGKDREAIAQLEHSLENEEHPYKRYLLGVAYRYSGDPTRGLFQWSRIPSVRDMLEPNINASLTRRQWWSLIDRRMQRARAQALAMCGHYYLDLNLPEQSRVCFAAADQRVKGLAHFARLEHLGETEPQKAMDALRKLLQKDKNNLELRTSIAATYLAMGDAAGFEAFVAERSLEASPRLPELEIRHCQLRGERSCTDREGVFLEW